MISWSSREGDGGAARGIDRISPDVALNDALVRHTLQTHVLLVVARGGTPVQLTPVADVNERCRHIGVPVLAGNGAVDAGDRLRLARELVDLVPDGTEVLVPDAAHHLDLEHPDAFNAALAAFLRGW